MVARKQEKEIIRMYKKGGLTDLEISAKLGVKPRDIFNVRKKKGLLTEAEEEYQRKTRRNVAIGGSAALLALGVGGGAYLIEYFLDSGVTYKNAVEDEAKRQQHIDKLVGPLKPDEVASVEYATPKILKELKVKYGYAPPPDAYAATIPQDESKAGKGTKSKIYVFAEAYRNLYREHPEIRKVLSEKEFYGDLGIIIKNVILKNEFTDARNFSAGIPGYSLEDFKDSSGSINYQLHNIVIDLISNSAEYRGLLEEPRFKKSRYIQLYAQVLKELVSAYYVLLSDQKISGGMDKEFIMRLKRDFHPSRLF